jgi:hypothetical protein
MKLFAINETIANINVLLLNIAGYYLWGLNGLGVAFTLSYLIYFIQVLVIVKKRYKFSFTSNFNKLFLIEFIFLISCFLIIYFWKSNFAYIPMTFLIMICTIYSFKELDKRIGLKSTLAGLKENFKKQTKINQ